MTSSAITFPATLHSFVATQRSTFLALLLAGLQPLLAQATEVAPLQACRSLTDPAARLACYDAALASESSTGGDAPVTVPATPSALAEIEPQVERRSLIAERWAIGVPARDSRFDLRPHRPTYLLLARYSDDPSLQPSSPSKPALGQPLDLRRTEAKFQLSFKVKLADFSKQLGASASLWAGYTQQSQWQLYNSSTSRPFRETNYEPEVMFALHPDYQALGWRWRLLGVGFNHQSNGRSEPLSRSWNRVTAQLGVERGSFALLIRPWWRLRESASTDDNPDITRTMGYGDVVAVYARGEHRFSLLTRYNPHSARGAVQGAWSFPLARRLNGYLQIFSGYGESLIDYNVHQNTIGLGVSLADYL